MEEFKIIVEEISREVVTAQAESEAEAVAQVLSDYKKGGVKLKPYSVTVRSFGNCETWESGTATVTIY